ncbi:hypothetical protein [Caudoviricetes sp.]|nr:hypothetical protein [Caudoviricetes sp.]
MPVRSPAHRASATSATDSRHSATTPKVSSRRRHRRKPGYSEHQPTSSDAPNSHDSAPHPPLQRGRGHRTQDRLAATDSACPGVTAAPDPAEDSGIRYGVPVRLARNKTHPLAVALAKEHEADERHHRHADPIVACHGQSKGHSPPTSSAGS